MSILARIFAFFLVAAIAGCGTSPELKTSPPLTPTPPVPVAPAKPVTPVIKVPPKIGLALGGGAARGFAHVGVIKALESQGIKVDIVTGTSAGSMVGALYAAGHGSYALQKIALRIDEATVSDWGLPNRGVIKGEQLQNFINQSVQNRPIEKLKKILGVVATNLKTGEQVVFRQGNTGMAVRASSSVPGVFQPVRISGKEYVDGGLTSPVPVNAAKGLGADIVIAVDISSKPKHGKVKDSIDVLLQTFSIMGQSIGNFELARADVVIRPNTGAVDGTDFSNKHLAILEGEKAGFAAIPLIREKIREFMGWGSETVAEPVIQAEVKPPVEVVRPAEVRKPAEVSKPAPVPVVESVPVFIQPVDRTDRVRVVAEEVEAEAEAEVKKSVPISPVAVITSPAPVTRPTPPAPAPALASAPITASAPIPTSAPVPAHPAAEAMYQLGLKQEREGNLAASFKSFHSAAYIGSGMAMKKLGDIYNIGNSLVRRDYETSIKWYSKASEHGIHIPKELLKR